MGKTPFAFAFDIEAVIPSKVKIQGYRTSQTMNEENDGALYIELSLLEERRLAFDIRNATYK